MPASAHCVLSTFSQALQLLPRKYCPAQLILKAPTSKLFNLLLRELRTKIDCSLAAGVGDMSGILAGKGAVFNKTVAEAALDRICLSSIVSEIEASTRDLGSLSPSSSCKVVSQVETW